MDRGLADQRAEIARQRCVAGNYAQPSGKRIGTCARCGIEIFGRRTKGARFCSGKCRTAAYRERKPPPSISALSDELAWSQAGEAKLREENAHLTAENAALRRALAQTKPQPKAQTNDISLSPSEYRRT